MRWRFGWRSGGHCGAHRGSTSYLLTNSRASRSIELLHTQLIGPWASRLEETRFLSWVRLGDSAVPMTRPSHYPCTLKAVRLAQDVELVLLSPARLPFRHSRDGRVSDQRRRSGRRPKAGDAPDQREAHRTKRRWSGCSHPGPRGTTDFHQAEPGLAMGSRAGSRGTRWRTKSRLSLTNKTRGASASLAGSSSQLGPEGWAS